MSYAAQYKAFANPDTKGRIVFAAFKMAQDVLNEDASKPNYQSRRNLATVIQNDPFSLADKLTLTCFRNTVIAGSAQDDGTLSVEDSDIEYVLSSYWDFIASDMRL